MLKHKTRVNLDNPVDLSQLDNEDPEHTWEFLRHYLQELLSCRCTALHLHVHEGFDFVRACLWQPSNCSGSWFELIPLQQQAGLSLLHRLRTQYCRPEAAPGSATGLLRYLWNGECGELFIESPHNWDVRLYADASRPDRLPYALVFQNNKSYREGPY